MPRPKKSGPEFRSSDREMAKKMLREYFQQRGGAEYLRNAQQPSMFQDTETGEYIARPQSFGGGGKVLKYENGGPSPESSADPLKSPAVQASIEKLLAPYRDQIDYMRQQRSKYGSNDPAVGGLRSQTRSAYAALEGAGEGDVDVLRGLISMEPTNREEAEQKAKAIEFAKSVSDEYAREMGTPVRNPLYNFFGLEGGPSYKNGGTVKYRSGGMMKYENGGPVGSASSDQKFRVIPEKSPTGQTELAYYIDGRPVESQDFMEQFYAVGNKPQDLNQLIENSVIASKQGVGAESLISGGSPLEGLMKQYRDALKERNVYREKGAAGIDSLYNARNENYERMIRQMGG